MHNDKSGQKKTWDGMGGVRLTVDVLFSEHEPVPAAEPGWLPAEHGCRRVTGCCRRPAAAFPEAAGVEPVRQLPQGCWLLIFACRNPLRVTEGICNSVDAEFAADGSQAKVAILLLFGCIRVTSVKGKRKRKRTQPTALIAVCCVFVKETCHRRTYIQSKGIRGVKF